MAWNFRLSIMFFSALFVGCATADSEFLKGYDTVLLADLPAILMEKTSIGRKISVSGPTRLSRRSQALYYDDRNVQEIFDVPCLQLLMPVESVLELTGSSGALHGQTFTILGELQHHPEIARGLSQHSPDEVVLSIELEGGIEINEIVCKNEDVYLHVDRMIRER